MTIAGSDNSAGAGAQADLKTMCALGVYGVTAITCVVAEVPGKVSAIQAMEPGIVAEQVRLLFGAYPIAAMKTGMLYSREIMDSVVQVFRRQPQLPALVVDPVMVATSGDSLLKGDGVSYYKDVLFPLATLVTPNLDEARVLTGRDISSIDELHAAGLELVREYGCAFLMKGGHLREAVARDLLVTADGTVEEFSAPFVPGVNTHGTGCTYSAAVASGLGAGLGLVEAVAQAKRFVSAAIGGFLRWDRPDGSTTDALHHFAGTNIKK
jgi:hydroxymethylpyrimidine/phosphomethylpyrimidine kinase